MEELEHTSSNLYSLICASWDCPLEEPWLWLASLCRIALRLKDTRETRAGIRVHDCCEICRCRNADGRGCDAIVDCDRRMTDGTDESRVQRAHRGIDDVIDDKAVVAARFAGAMVNEVLLSAA